MYTYDLTYLVKTNNKRTFAKFITVDVEAPEDVYWVGEDQLKACLLDQGVKPVAATLVNLSIVGHT